jgi:hypothetical protein
MSWSIRIEGVTPQDVIEQLTNRPAPSDLTPAAVVAFNGQRAALIAQANAAKDAGLPEYAAGIAASAWGHINPDGVGSSSSAMGFLNKPVEPTVAVTETPEEVPAPEPETPSTPEAEVPVEDPEEVEPTEEKTVTE